MLNNYKVYCLTNMINGKKYIGITKQEINKRWRNGLGYKKPTRIGSAIARYGWSNFKKEVIFDNLTKEQAGKLEIEYIAKLDTINTGYNVQEGGFNSNNGIVSEETRKKLSLSHKGQHNSPETEFKKGQHSKAHLVIMKPVKCVETGKVYESIRQAQRELKLNHIWDCLKGIRNKCGGYHWELVKEGEV